MSWSYSPRWISTPRAVRRRRRDEQLLDAARRRCAKSTVSRAWCARERSRRHARQPHTRQVRSAPGQALLERAAPQLAALKSRRELPRPKRSERQLRITAGRFAPPGCPTPSTAFSAAARTPASSHVSNRLVDLSRALHLPPRTRERLKTARSPRKSALACAFASPIPRPPRHTATAASSRTNGRPKRQIVLHVRRERPSPRHTPLSPTTILQPTRSRVRSSVFLAERE